MPLSGFGWQTTDSIQVLIADSILNDTLLVSDTTSSKAQKAVIQDKIPYKADQISISANGNKIYLNGNAQIIYQELTLNAERIIIDKEKNKLFAYGVLDSMDEQGKEYYKGNPVFTEKGQEPMRGSAIEYDFETKRGKISVGRTNMPPGYYKGENIYKIADSTLLVEDGYFTTCNLEEDPHFYFRADRMRMKLKDKMVAKPIYFYIADIPLAVAPYGIFPTKSGRRSGILIPSYGETRYGGRFLEGLGYYWAPNDYMDATMETTFYDQLGFTYRGNVRYAIRYLLNGGISGSYEPKDRLTGQRRERWSFSYNHQQTIDPTFTISGSGSFQSDKDYRRQTSPNIDERLRQNITSTLNMNKSWKGTKNSMSVSLRHDKNLQTDETNWTFPNLSFRRGQSGIWETVTGESVGTNRAWYQNIYFSYNANGLRKGYSNRQVIAVTDSTRDTSLVSDETLGLRHSLSFNAPQKIFGYFNINPSASYDEIWVDEITKGRLSSDSTEIEQYRQKEFAIRRTFNSSVSLNTKLYGLFEPNIGSLKYIRHTISPSVSFTYTPDFSDPFYGYFNEVRNRDGEVVYVDKFRNSPFGGTSARESKRMGFSIGNLFQSKFIDEEGKEEKVDFFRAGFDAGYDFNADSIKWSDLRSNFNTQILGKSISITTTHSLYKLKSTGGKTATLFYENKNLPRLISLNTSFGYTIDNKTFASSAEKKEPTSRRQQRSSGTEQPETEEAVSDTLSSDNIFESSTQMERERTKKIDIPWSTSFNLIYSLNRANPSETIERISLSTKADFRITKNWKFSWQANFDLVEQELIYQNFNIYRDLHCWEMSFNWQPMQQYFLFRINIKDAILQDIKYTRRPHRTIYNTY